MATWADLVRVTRQDNNYTARVSNWNRDTNVERARDWWRSESGVFAELLRIRVRTNNNGGISYKELAVTLLAIDEKNLYRIILRPILDPKTYLWIDAEKFTFYFPRTRFARNVSNGKILTHTAGKKFLFRPTVLPNRWQSIIVGFPNSNVSG